MASSIAFFWAVDPSPSRVPERAAPDAPAPEPPAPPVEESLELSSEPQAARASAPTRVIPPMRTGRESFTSVVSFVLVFPGPGLGQDGAGRARPAPGVTLGRAGEAMAGSS